MVDWAGHPDRYVGVDQSVELLQRAKSAHPAATFIAAELHCLPFVDRCLPVVIANAVLEHVFRLEISVEEIARCLSVDGYFYALVPTEGGLVAELARSVTSRRNAQNPRHFYPGVPQRPDKGSLQLRFCYQQRAEEALSTQSDAILALFSGRRHISTSQKCG